MILRGFIKKEIIQALRDPHLAVMILLAPLFQLLLFGYALTNEVKNLRLAIYNPPSDVVAQEIYDHALATKWFIPAREQTKDPIEDIQMGRADAVIVAPDAGISTRMQRPEGNLQLLVNASNVLRAQAMDVYMQRIVQTVTQTTLKQDPTTTALKGVPSSPLTVSVRMLYNPSMDSMTFTVPGLVAALLTTLVIVLTCTSIAKEKESGTFETILSAPIHRRQIILGKTIPFVLVGILNVVIVLVASCLFFHLPFRGSLIGFGIASLCFLYTAVMTGILMSTFVENQQQSMLCGFIVLFVAMLLSGAFFSIENMPAPLRMLSYVNPLAHYTFLVRNIMLKGGDGMYLLMYCSALLGVGSVIAFFSFKRFKITLG